VLVTRHQPAPKAAPDPTAVVPCRFQTKPNMKHACPAELLSVAGSVQVRWRLYLVVSPQ
jgi:hypothetical protein